MRLKSSGVQNIQYPTSFRCTIHTAAMASGNGDYTQIRLVDPQPVDINDLIEMVHEINAQWAPMLGQCVMFLKPMGRPDWAWAECIVDMVESYADLNDAEKVYAIIALKRYYKV
jgi:hypothetical protein